LSAPRRFGCAELHREVFQLADAMSGWCELEVVVEGRISKLTPGDNRPEVSFWIDDDTGSLQVHARNATVVSEAGAEPALHDGARVRVHALAAVGNQPFGLYPLSVGRVTAGDGMTITVLPDDG
jgi:hypothetical protein